MHPDGSLRTCTSVNLGSPVFRVCFFAWQLGSISSVFFSAIVYSTATTYLLNIKIYSFSYSLECSLLSLCFCFSVIEYWVDDKFSAALNHVGDPWALDHPSCQLNSSRGNIEYHGRSRQLNVFHLYSKLGNQLYIMGRMNSVLFLLAVVLVSFIYLGTIFLPRL